MHKQLILTEFNNCGPSLERLTSAQEITLERAVAFITERDGFDEERDALTLVDEPEETNIDEDHVNS